MKKVIALLLAMAMVLCMVACSAGTNDDVADNGNNNASSGNEASNNAGNDAAADNSSSSSLAGTYEITMWVSETDGVAAQFQEQIARFNETNEYGITIVASIEGVTEADAGSKVVADVATAPDIYCFAQDQLARLVQAGALAAPGTGACATITENNDSGSVAAASVGGTIYAYPMTSDNGYYLYYDTSVVTDPDSLEAIIADCEANGKLFRFALENAWYTASFFFATDCHSNWTMDTDGNFTSVDDDFNSEAGLAAMKGMQKLATSSCYDSNADIFTDAAAIVTGIWNANAAAEAFGDNLGVADLPSFEVDGTSYHLGSYTGNKLVGVKPQNDPATAAVLSQLAQYLTNEECQLERYNQFQWGPSNKAAQASEAVQANTSLAALAAQNEYGQPQGQIHGSWWDIAKLLGADAKAATSEDDLKTALEEYDAAIAALFQMSDEQKNAWSVIGSLCGTNWDTDFPMTETDTNTFTSEVLALNVGDELKVRQGASWDVNFGLNGEAGGANIVVETAGNYQVQLVYDGETATVELIPA